MKYLISGYYGEKNLGDDAILAGLLQEIERLDPQARFTVFSFDPKDTERRHSLPGRSLKVISTVLRSPFRLRLAFKEADLFISGGGSFLHEADFALCGRSFLFREGKLRPIPYFLSLVFMARAFGVPVMWYAQGLGPLHTKTAKCWVSQAGSISQVVTWRDSDSARLSYEIGMRAPVQLVVSDPAYALQSAPAEEVQDFLQKQRPFIAVCPRPWLGQRGYLENLGIALEKAATQLDLEVLFIPFHKVHDGPVCESLAARPGFAGRARVLPACKSLALLVGVLASAELVVAMRLHSGILSSVAGTPAVIIDYDPKTRAYAKQTRQLPWTIPVDELECAAGAEQLLTAIMDTANALPARRAQLAPAVAFLREESIRAAQLAVQLATGKIR